MEEFLNSIGINKRGTYSDDNSYVIDLSDDREYAKYYSILDRSDELDLLEDSSTVTFDNANVMFQSDEYMINIIADWNADTYKIVIKGE